MSRQIRESRQVNFPVYACRLTTNHNLQGNYQNSESQNMEIQKKLNEFQIFIKNVANNVYFPFIEGGKLMNKMEKLLCIFNFLGIETEIYLLDDKLIFGCFDNRGWEIVTFHPRESLEILLKFQENLSSFGDF